MTTVIANVQADITSNAGTTGAAVLGRLSHKRHQVKQAIGRLLVAGTISVVIAGNGRWYDNQFTIV